MTRTWAEVPRRHLVSRRIASPITPETAIARLSTSTEAMSTMSALEKPRNAWFTGTTPVTIVAASASAATTS